MGSLPVESVGPQVLEQQVRVKALENWEAMRAFDVVVSTPNGVSPDYTTVPKPPGDLFDLLLIDEAHHSPAKTWNAILECFPDAEKVLFTATPYRLDGREIKAKQIYSYPIRHAYEDKVFGKVAYRPVLPSAGVSNDLAIASAVEAAFQADQAQGFNHRVMVRTSQIKRAKALAELYAKNTQLKLELVTSHHSARHMRSAVDRLKSKELDGVVCVDMMSEGFDFPWLKLAALHAPHKSLAVTLQFIGRFARTNAPDIGEAKFFAVPGDVGGEVQELYDESSVWKEIIVELQERRLGEEAEVREGIDSFAAPLVSDFEVGDLSLYSLWPYAHVKVYRVAHDSVDIGAKLALPKPFRVVHHQVSEEQSVALLITNERLEPRWTALQVFARSEYDLFVVYFDKRSKLLFINASRKSPALYEEVARHYSLGAHKVLPRYAIDRVRHKLQNAEFFNVGMKNRVAHSNAESYRTLSGKRADRAVIRADGRSYHRGHLFGKGTVDGVKVTLGYSTASKVWSNQNLQIPHLVKWCKDLAVRLTTDTQSPAHPGLDYLPVGEAIKKFPDGILLVQWPPEVYDRHVDIDYHDAKGEKTFVPVSDVELVLDRTKTDSDQVTFSVVHEEFCYAVVCRLDGGQFFTPSDASRPQPTLAERGDEVELLTFLNNQPATFLCADYSSVCGDEQIRYPALKVDPFDPQNVHPVDWDAEGVDVTLEFVAKGKTANKKSIHDFLWRHLNRDEFSAVVYDHRVCEAADFVTFSRDGDKVVISLYHCKGSGEPYPGDRVDDLYEVCGQGIKCLAFIEKEAGLERHLKHRTDSGSSFVRGDFATVKKEFEHGKANGFVYRVVLVQPGVTRSALSVKCGEVLAATNDYLTKSGVRDVLVVGSN